MLLKNNNKLVNNFSELIIVKLFSMLSLHIKYLHE